MLNNASLVGFIPTRDADRARPFYEQVLELTFVSDDTFALVFRTDRGSMLRVVRVGEFTPAPFTILGWEVTGIEERARDLAGRGVACLRFSFLVQDDDAVWTAPGGDKVLWFKDPDGNTLSLSQHAHR